MIVPMKKVSLIVLYQEREAVLKQLRKLGLLHISMMEGQGERLHSLHQRCRLIEQAIALLPPKQKKDEGYPKAETTEAFAVAEKIASLAEEKKLLYAQLAADQAEKARLAAWGDVSPEALDAISEKGWNISFYELPRSEYERLQAHATTVPLAQSKHTVRAAVVQCTDQDALTAAEAYRFRIPERSAEALLLAIQSAELRLQSIDAELQAFTAYVPCLEQEILALQKEMEWETYSTGMAKENLSAKEKSEVNIAYFKGYLSAEDLPKLQALAKAHAWGLLAEDPTPEDDVPTKLQNNKLVSLIYPLTDFLGTVPGYFEYDISAWFLGFIMAFFGIIFGDGGYGLLMCAIAGIPILRSLAAKKPIAPAFLLIELLGASTVLWGLLTCTWFGIDPALLPKWLQSLSVPVLSNVYADHLWQPFWTSGAVGLTTSQNVQIFCFSLALVQLSVAHIMGMFRNAGSLKLLGDLGSILQLLGIFYVVLSLVVNGEVFGLSLVLGGIPIGTLAVVLVLVGFLLSFVFSNYDGSLAQSVLTSLKNIVSCLLGVVNVFSDIVSYIRLWAVGLAGAAISATVNELAGPLLGNFLFMIFAVFLLVFGHGLNMILNVLSVIVHGVRLNTLEFSSHLDMAWSGQKYRPFEE